MRTNLQGIDSLKNLRQQWQEDAGEEYPRDVLSELLVLYDVCEALDLNIFEARDVMGTTGLQAVREHINSPADIT